MKQMISGWLKAPEFPNDDEKTRRGKLAYILALNILVVLLFFGMGGVIFIFTSKLISGLFVAIFILLALLSLVILRQGYVTLASAIFLVSIWLTSVAMVSLSDGMRSLDIIFFITGTVLAGLLLDIRGALIFASASIAAGLVMVVLSSLGVQFPNLFPFPPISGWALLTINLAFTILPLSMTLQSLHTALNRARKELADRQRAEEKLVRLNAISLSISTLQDLDSVFESIYAELHQSMSLDLFLVSLYDPLTNEISYPFVIDEGRRSQELPHQRNQGTLFDRVLTSGKTVLVNRTAEELAQRNAAMAVGKATYIGVPRASASLMYVPLIAQAQVIGLISVQSYTLMAYDENSLEFLKNIGLQATIAIQNARLFEAQQQELVERKNAEYKLQESLQEKEVLLKEVHHRVKNNMQVIVSLMNLQSGYITDPLMLNMLRESQNRVRTMALVHEKLYQSQYFAKIDFREYLQHLASTLFHTYSPHTSNLDMVFGIGEITLSVDTAIPCGLIVNELISNALKHAYPDQRTGKVQIRLQNTETGLLELSIADDGIGFPEGKDWRKTDTLGMQLVQSLVKQINGTIEMRRLDPGTYWNVQFKIPGN